MNVFSKSKIPGLSRRDLLAAAALGGLAPGILQAQDRYPSKPIKLVANPVQFNHEPARNTRAPDLCENTRAVLCELGVDAARIEALSAKGVIGCA